MHDPEGLYFLSFATVGWIDVLTRREYKDVVVESLRFCQEQKGLDLFEWVIMTNHVHLLARAKPGSALSDILKSRKSSVCAWLGGRGGRRLVRRISSNRSPACFPWLPKPWRRRGTGHHGLYFPLMNPVLFSERTIPDSGGRSHRLREARRRLADRHPPHKSPRANPGRGKTCAIWGGKRSADVGTSGIAPLARI